MQSDIIAVAGIGKHFLSICTSSADVIAKLSEEREALEKKLKRTKKKLTTLLAEERAKSLKIDFLETEIFDAEDRYQEI